MVTPRRPALRCVWITQPFSNCVILRVYTLSLCLAYLEVGLGLIESKV